MPKGVYDRDRKEQLERMALITQVMTDDLPEGIQAEIIDAETQKFKNEELEAKKKAFAAQIAVKLRKNRGRARPGELVEDVVIDVAPFAIVAHGGLTGINLDGQIYEHGKIYSLPANMAKSVREACARSWKHERVIKGEPEFVGRPFAQSIVNTTASMTVRGGTNQ